LQTCLVCLYFTGLVIAIYHLTQLHTLTTFHCHISGDMDARNLYIVGFSRSRTNRSVSTGGKIPPSLRTAALRHPGGRASLPGRRTIDASASNSSTSSDRLYFLLGFFPSLDTSYFFAFSVDGSDSLSMERNDPMHIDTQDHNCSAVLPRGAVAYCGTTTGALIRWNIRWLLFIESAYKLQQKYLLMINICALWECIIFTRMQLTHLVIELQSLILMTEYFVIKPRCFGVVKWLVLSARSSSYLLTYFLPYYSVSHYHF